MIPIQHSVVDFNRNHLWFNLFSLEEIEDRSPRKLFRLPIDFDLHEDS